MLELIIIGALALLAVGLWFVFDYKRDWPTGEKYDSFWDQHK